MVKTAPLTTPTGARKQISGWLCHEYQLNYPPRFGLTTAIWSTARPGLADKSSFKKLWYAAVGASPPMDVRNIINALLREINGIPVRLVSTIEQEDLVITTMTTIISIEHHSGIPEDFFNIPPDYKVYQAEEQP